MDKWIDDYRKGDHAVHVYSSDYECKKILIDIAEWADRDEKVVWLSDKSSSGKIAVSRKPADGRLNSDLRNGRVEIKPSYKSYCPGGVFLGSKMFEFWGNVRKEALKEGYKGLVVIGDVSWLKDHQSVFEPFMRYEQAIDFARLPENLTLLCQYDERLFTGDQLRAAENVHQLHLRNGRLERSYWFVLRRMSEEGSSPESSRRPSIISESFMRQV
jgi:hypothetical protein